MISSDLDPLSAVDSNTLSFYEANAIPYANQTAKVDLTHLYSSFLSRLPLGARILDIGCGSGRDLKAFHEKGYEAIGVDPSPSLVKIAREWSGCKVEVGRAETLRFKAMFDGVWACASLLHLPRRYFPLALSNINKCLKRDSILFLSMQEGSGEGACDDGRYFSYYSRQELGFELNNAGFEIIQIWTTADSLCKRNVISWINIVARKIESSINLPVHL